MLDLCLYQRQIPNDMVSMVGCATNLVVETTKDIVGLKSATNADIPREQLSERTMQRNRIKLNQKKYNAHLRNVGVEKKSEPAILLSKFTI